MATQNLSAPAPEGKTNGQKQPGNVILPVAVCDNLYTGLLECHGTATLLAQSVLNADGDDGGLYSSLCLLKHRMDGLSELVDPHVIHAATIEPTRPSANSGQTHAPCEDLYTGLLECHDTAALLADYALNTAREAKEIGLMYAALNMLKNRLDSLMCMSSPTR